MYFVCASLSSQLLYLFNNSQEADFVQFLITPNDFQFKSLKKSEPRNRNPKLLKLFAGEKIMSLSVY